LLIFPFHGDAGFYKTERGTYDWTKILLVDDEKDFVSALEKRLLKRGMKVGLSIFS